MLLPGVSAVTAAFLFFGPRRGGLMAEANLARRGVMTVSFITGRCARLLRAGRRRISLASAIIVTAGLNVT